MGRTICLLGLSALIGSCCPSAVEFEQKAAWAEKLPLEYLLYLNQSEAYLRDKGVRMTFTLSCPHIFRSRGAPVVEYLPCLANTTAHEYRVYFDRKGINITSYEEIIASNEKIPVDLM